MDEKLLPSESILHYLQNTPEYYGRAVSPERFKSFNSNGQPIPVRAVLKINQITSLLPVFIFSSL